MGRMRARGQVRRHAHTGHNAHSDINKGEMGRACVPVARVGGVVQEGKVLRRVVAEEEVDGLQFH